MLKSANAFTDRREMIAVMPRSRRRCHCGCGKRATHIGLANSMAMTRGCELYVRRWVKDPANAVLSRSRLKS